MCATMVALARSPLQLRPCYIPVMIAIIDIPWYAAQCQEREKINHTTSFLQSLLRPLTLFSNLSNLATFYVISRILRKIRLYQYLILRNVDGGGAQALSRDWSKKNMIHTALIQVIQFQITYFSTKFLNQNSNCQYTLFQVEISLSILFWKKIESENK